MILVEYNASSEDVGIHFDNKGGELLIKLIKELLERSEQDHTHIGNGPSEIAGWKQPEESHALSLTPFYPREDWDVASMLTLIRRIT